LAKWDPAPATVAVDAMKTIQFCWGHMAAFGISTRARHRVPRYPSQPKDSIWQIARGQGGRAAPAAGHGYILVRIPPRVTLHVQFLRR